MFQSFTNSELSILFILSAAVVWFSGIWLARSTNSIDHRFRLGGALGGLVILAVATNLPEIAITLSAAVSNNMSLALGNILGGIAIQTVVLVFLDFLLRKKKKPLSTLAKTKKLKLEVLLLVFLLIVLVIGSNLPVALPIGPLHGADILIAIIWIFGVFFISRKGKTIAEIATTGRETHPEHQTTKKIPHRHVYLIFLLASIATLIAGVILEESGSLLATHFGWSGFLFGTTVLALATAIPEISTGMASIKMKDYELAMSDIFGGNAFLLLLFIPAGLLAGHSLFLDVMDGQFFMILTSLTLTLIYLVGLHVKEKHRVFKLGVDSWFVLIFYTASIFILTFFF